MFLDKTLCSHSAFLSLPRCMIGLTDKGSLFHPEGVEILLVVYSAETGIGSSCVGHWFDIDFNTLP